MKLFKIFLGENVTVSTITGGLGKSDNTLKYCLMICTVYQNRFEMSYQTIPTFRKTCD